MATKLLASRNVESVLKYALFCMMLGLRELKLG